MTGQPAVGEIEGTVARQAVEGTAARQAVEGTVGTKVGWKAAEEIAGSLEAKAVLEGTVESSGAAVAVAGKTGTCWRAAGAPGRLILPAGTVVGLAACRAGIQVGLEPVLRPRWLCRHHPQVAGGRRDWGVLSVKGTPEQGLDTPERGLDTLERGLGS